MVRINLYVKNDRKMLAMLGLEPTIYRFIRQFFEIMTLLNLFLAQSMSKIMLKPSFTENKSKGNRLYLHILLLYGFL